MKFAEEKLELKMPQNDKNVILPITFNAFLDIFKAFLKILHKI